jgi:hypothetical protein
VGANKWREERSGGDEGKDEDGRGRMCYGRVAGGMSHVKDWASVKTDGYGKRKRSKKSERGE